MKKEPAACRPRKKLDLERVVYCGIERCFFEVGIDKGLFRYQLSKHLVTTDSARNAPPCPPDLGKTMDSIRQSTMRSGRALSPQASGVMRAHREGTSSHEAAASASLPASPLAGVGHPGFSAPLGAAVESQPHSTPERNGASGCSLSDDLQQVTGKGQSPAERAATVLFDEAVPSKGAGSGTVGRDADVVEATRQSAIPPPRIHIRNSANGVDGMNSGPLRPESSDATVLHFSPAPGTPPLGGHDSAGGLCSEEPGTPLTASARSGSVRSSQRTPGLLTQELRKVCKRCTDDVACDAMRPRVRPCVPGQSAAVTLAPKTTYRERNAVCSYQMEIFSVCLSCGTQCTPLVCGVYTASMRCPLLHHISGAYAAPKKHSSYLPRNACCTWCTFHHTTMMRWMASSVVTCTQVAGNPHAQLGNEVGAHVTNMQHSIEFLSTACSSPPAVPAAVPVPVKPPPALAAAAGRDGTPSARAAAPAGITSHAGETGQQQGAPPTATSPNDMEEYLHWAFGRTPAQILQQPIITARPPIYTEDQHAGGWLDTAGKLNMRQHGVNSLPSGASMPLYCHSWVALPESKGISLCKGTCQLWHP